MIKRLVHLGARQGPQPFTPTEERSMTPFAKFATVGALLASAVGAHAAEATYVIDPTHTFVTFEVKHFGTSTNRGRFDQKSGTVQFDREGKSGQADITIQMGSMNTGTPALDHHLESKDFFNAELYPTSHFHSNKFVFDGDRVVAVVGDLTMLGKTQTVTLQADGFNCYQNPHVNKQVCGGDFETVLHRSAFGMDFAVPMIPDEVHLLIQVEAVRQ